MVEEKEKKKPHFVCEINYSPDQDWRTDFSLGQRGSNSHGHMTLSGAQLWYLRDEQGNELVVDGQVITNTSQLSSDCKPDPTKEAKEKNEDKKYPPKKDLEKLYNKEEGYYDSYSWFEDLICNVCGKIIQGDGSKEYFESEQEVLNDGTTINFCSDCAKLPNRSKLIKNPV